MARYHSCDGPNPVPDLRKTMVDVKRFTSLGGEMACHLSNAILEIERLEWRERELEALVVRLGGRESDLPPTFRPMSQIAKKKEG
jgi:hypothetical protein